MSDTLTCSNCKQTLLATDFSRNFSITRGYAYNCKTCSKQIIKERRRKNLSNWHKEINPKKTKARSVVNNALASGSLRREGCFLCNEAETVAHHLSYDFPLSVIWLCKVHHAEVHRGR